MGDSRKGTQRIENLEQFRLSKEFRQRTSGSRRSLAFNLLIRFQNRGGMRISEEDRASEEDTASQIGARAAGGRGADAVGSTRR